MARTRRNPRRTTRRKKYYGTDALVLSLHRWRDMTLQLHEELCARIKEFDHISKQVHSLDKSNESDESNDPNESHENEDKPTIEDNAFVVGDDVVEYESNEDEESEYQESEDESD